ncbi:MAG TPA: hypothetical protein VFT29_00275 [Gemmatimonadaceae bacterium]|nr:hypothetical protein [Gemmatimonadaceae bacterium]
MRKLSVANLVLVEASLAGCNPFKAPSYPQIGCGFALETRACVALETRPAVVNILRGDTIRIVTRSDSGYGRATWTVSGLAATFAIVGGAIASQLLTPDTTALVMGIAVGTSEVRAQSTRPPYAATSSIGVGDSSSMTTLSIWYPTARRDTTITLGVEMALVAELRDAQSQSYIVRPIWTSTDASVIAIAPPTCGVCYPRAVTKGYGLARVIAQFRDLRDTLQIFVAP